MSLSFVSWMCEETERALQLDGMLVLGLGLAAIFLFLCLHSSATHSANLPLNLILGHLHPQHLNDAQLWLCV